MEEVPKSIYQVVQEKLEQTFGQMPLGGRISQGDRMPQEGQFEDIPYHIWAVLAVGFVLGVYVLYLSKKELDAEL